jgi:hypothetical protein
MRCPVRSSGRGTVAYLFRRYVPFQVGYLDYRANTTMSFGFSVGDFIAAIELANKIRKDFVDAPGQFSGMSDVCVVLPVETPEHLLIMTKC